MIIGYTYIPIIYIRYVIYIYNYIIKVSLATLAINLSCIFIILIIYDIICW